MVSRKNKRRIEYDLEYPFLDTEVPVTPQDIRKHLKEYYTNII